MVGCLAMYPVGTTSEPEKMVKYTMMTYTITYRNKDGKTDWMQLDASDRGAVFAELSKRGISAIRVEEAVGKAKPRKPSSMKGGKSPAVGKGMVAGIIVVAAAVAAFWFLSRNQPEVSAESKGKKQSKIAEVKPYLAAPVKAEEPKPEPPKPLPPQRIGETRDGKVLLPDGTLHTVKGVITSGVARVSLIDRTFKHDTDCMLAHLLVVEPGEGFVGDSESIYSGFEKEFLKTLDDPIVYDKNDSDYVKELKMGVQALRQELLDARANGESIEKVLMDTRDQLQQLGLYRQELEEQVLRMSEDGMNQQDYNDLITAANKMLEERGSKPLELPSTVKHAVRLGQLIRDNEAKEKEKENEK